MSNTSLLGSFGGQAGDALMFRNRIINGDMRIDQRNAGASINPTDGQFVVDRFAMGVSQASKLTVQQSAIAPSGFSNSVLITSSSSYAVLAGDYFGIRQGIEGFNIADLAWGTADAKPAALSFWVRSSLTGTFAGSLRNQSATRSYPFNYTINSANTWEQKTVIIPGDTTGTWLTNNGQGINLWFALGTGSNFSGTAGAWAGSNFVSATGATSLVGTNGATFYLTGVQLEAGPTATPFERRPIGVELQLALRYYQKITQAMVNSSLNTTNELAIWIKSIVPMRTDSTMTVSLANADYVAGAPSGNQWTLYRPGTGYATKTGTVTFVYESTAGPIDGNLITSSGATFSGGGNNKLSCAGTSGIVLSAEL